MRVKTLIRIALLAPILIPDPDFGLSDRVGGEKMSFAQSLKSAATQKGLSLSDLNHQSPVLVIFLRHFG